MSGVSTYVGTNAVVTGGGSGIGLAVAELLVEGGARVLITGRSGATLESARERLGDNALTLRGDVSVPSDLDRLACCVAEEFGSLQALFVNAGIAPLTPVASTTEEAFENVFSINVKGAYFTLQKLRTLMAPGAGVVLTTSVANTMGLLDTSVYAASKAAVRSLTRTFARELIPQGVRVNAISPGPIDTGILESMMSREAAARFEEDRVADNPMRRFGTPVEIAKAAAFLAFDATYTTGVELVADGGTTQL